MQLRHWLLALGGIGAAVGCAWGQMPPPSQQPRCVFCAKWAGDVFFERGEVLLSAEQHRYLSELVELPKAKGCPFTVWAVVGHAASAEGSGDRLRFLASARASSVAKDLERNGVPAAQICRHEKGGSEPGVGGRNARVEMEVVCEAEFPAAKLVGCGTE